MVRNPASENPISPVGTSWTAPVRCPRCKKETRVRTDRCSHCGYSFRETRALEEAETRSAESLVGTVINDKYRVVSVLGEGGFGVVYLVELLLFDTKNTFALKLLHPSISQDPRFRRRFLREAALAMQLIHENTIQIREFGRTEDGSLFYTMDYCRGEPLNTVLAREGFLTVNRALNVTQQILSVMQLAHSRGIIHRDLKPENVFLERDDWRRHIVKVGDFGLAKSYEDGGGESGITHGGILGTPRYMSPEQARGSSDLDCRSDLYSIGVMLYEMLYGEVHGDSLWGDGAPEERGAGSTASKSLLRPPDQPGHVVPQRVWQIVRKAVAPRRRDRFQSAEEFSAAIRALPSYTPSYLEPQPSRAEGGFPWWRRVAVLLVVGLSVSLLASLLWERLPFFGGDSSGAKEPATATAALIADNRRPPASVSAYLRFRPGQRFTYEVFDEHGPVNRELTFQILEETEPGVFRVRVPEGREIRWVVDESNNVFYREFVLPDPETGELDRVEQTEILRLPAGAADRLRGDFVEGGRRVHGSLIDLEGRYPDCLLVESLEGTQRRLHYFKEGVGLVGLEVYEIEDDEEHPVDARARGRRVYARYLKS